MDEEKDRSIKPEDEPATQSDESDAEGHMFLPDIGAGREIARQRERDIERRMADRGRKVEGRPNR